MYDRSYMNLGEVDSVWKEYWAAERKNLLEDFSCIVLCVDYVDDYEIHLIKILSRWILR